MKIWDLVQEEIRRYREINNVYIDNCSNLFLTGEAIKHCRKMPDEYLNENAYANYKNQDTCINLIYENGETTIYFIVNWATFNIWIYAKSIKEINSLWAYENCYWNKIYERKKQAIKALTKYHTEITDELKLKMKLANTECEIDRIFKEEYAKTPYCK